MTDVYEPNPTVDALHGSPRFGHSNAFANLFSNDSEDTADYVQGVVTFGIFLLTLLTVWLTVLLLLKLTLGRQRIGCAAGGGAILVNDIKKNQPELKPILQNMVRRSWRIQSFFLIAAVLLPVATGLFLYKGLETMVGALENIQYTNQDIERVAYRSIGIVNSLIQERDRLVEMNAKKLFDIETHCPRLFLINNADNSSTALFQNMTFGQDGSLTSQMLTDTLNDMDRLVDDNVLYAKVGLESVSQMTEQVDFALEIFFDNDWIPKLYLMTLNVINVFLIAGVVLSRHNIIHYPYKCMLVWFLVPIFITLLSVATVGTSAMGMAASLNADFCAGSDTIAGPKGTLEDIILNRNITKTDLSYQSFDYYMNACTTENPLDFVVDFGPQLRDTIRQGNDFLKLVGDISLDGMNMECGADATPLVRGVQQLVESLDIVHANVESALEISDCASISPIVRGIFHGASCKEAVDGLAWMFGTTLAISVLGLILITLRAALYNATIRKARKSRPEERQREFREYKRYMSQYYEDAAMWKLEADGKKKTSGDEHGLELAQSFDTGITAKSTFEKDDDDGSEESYSIEDDDSDSDSDNSLDVQFKTPCKADAKTFVQQVKTAEKMRTMLHVLDEELQPLSPQLHPAHQHDSPQMSNNSEKHRPRAPQKSFKHLQRTTQRKTLL